jgi:N-acetyl-1-D-myo-inositol-2-amino-2-deoxy-alpha-D-glucopyranoside deacetylase
MSVLDGVSTVLLAHAHPDDETIASGALIAELVSRGIRVLLLTATGGERGEVVPALRESIHNAFGADPEALTLVREGELRSAMGILGISKGYLLGTPPARAPGLPQRRYRDSGMAWIRPGLAAPADDAAPDALSTAPLNEVTDDVRALIASIHPDLVVSYDHDGGYGHPDHVRIREAALGAALSANVPFAELLAADLAELLAADRIPVQADGAEWFELDAHLDTVRRALRAHATQVTVVGRDLIHSGGQRQRIPTSVGLRPVTSADESA